MTFKLIKCCLEIYLTMSHFLHIYQILICLQINLLIEIHCSGINLHGLYT